MDKNKIDSMLIIFLGLLFFVGTWQTRLNFEVLASRIDLVKATQENYAIVLARGFHATQQSMEEVYFSLWLNTHQTVKTTLQLDILFDYQTQVTEKMNLMIENLYYLKAKIK